MASKVLTFEQARVNEDLLHVYIAGPMRGYPEYNFPAFDAAAALLRNRAFLVVSPAELIREHGFNEKTDVFDESGGETGDIDDAIDRDIAAIRALDRESGAVAVLPGWEHSVGARAEVAYATWRGLSIILMPGAEPNPLAATVGVNTPPGESRVFSTGATRDTAANKPEFAGYLSPVVLRRFGVYMLKHQEVPGGTRRASDNWKAGMPRRVYLESLLRHVLDVWEGITGDVAEGVEYGGERLEDALCAVLFNAGGLLREILLGRDAK